jgi:hypothetical protein
MNPFKDLPKDEQMYIRHSLLTGVWPTGEKVSLRTLSNGQTFEMAVCNDFDNDDCVRYSVCLVGGSYWRLDGKSDSWGGDEWDDLIAMYEVKMVTETVVRWRAK